MPEYKPDVPDAEWVFRRSWPEVRTELEELREQEEDCAGFRVRSDDRTDETRADEHSETKGLFEPPGTTGGPRIARDASAEGTARTEAVASEWAPRDAPAQAGGRRAPLLQQLDRRHDVIVHVEEPPDARREDDSPEDAVRDGDVAWEAGEEAPRIGRPSPPGRAAPPNAWGPAPGGPAASRSRDRTPGFASPPGGAFTTVVEGMSELLVLFCSGVVRHWRLTALGLLALYVFGGFGLFSGDGGSASRPTAGIESAEEAAPADGVTGGAAVPRPDVSIPGAIALGGGEDEGVGVDAPRPTTVAEGGGGSLTVRAEPASRVELDGSDVGSTGSSGLLVLSGIRPGRHVVVARKPGHAEATGVVEIAEGRSEVVELTLDALPGTLTVSANVPGAILRIQGAGEHRLPVSRLALPAGARLLTVTGAGYEPVEENVEIRAGEATTLEVVLEPVPVEELVRVVRDRFDAGEYPRTVEGARAVLDIRPDTGAAHLLLGRALYQLGRFDESVASLYRAILLGEQVVLPSNHRHGGGGFRQGFCRGVVSLSTSEIAFRSRDEPGHGFAVSPEQVTDVEVAEGVGGQAFRLNTRVQEQGTRGRSFDFVHRNAARRRQDPDSPLFVVLTCPDCDGSMGVQAALMARLSRP